MSKTPENQPVPMSDAIALDEAGQPYLSGQRCTSCGEVLPGRHLACPRCFATGTLEPVRLGMRGTVFAWTIVMRSFPGVKVPLISAVVALEGGGYIKGNIEGLLPDPDAVANCPGISVAFDRVTAPDGTQLVRYVFHPEKEAAQ